MSAAGGRARILARIQEALQGRVPAPHPGALPAGVGPLPAGTSDLESAFGAAFARAGGDTVFLEDLGDARAWLATFSAGFASAAVSPEVPASLRPELPGEAPANAQLGVSVAVAAAAATGSLLLSSKDGRALQLLPPVHLVWVDAAKLRPELGDALAAARSAAPLPAALAVHSGPSKSADIGRILVTGVHGPGKVVAAVVRRWKADA